MKIITVAINDLTRSLRSAFTIGMAVVAPLVLTGLFYFAFSGMSAEGSSLPTIKAGVINHDRLPGGDSPLERPLGDNIRAMFFDESVAGWIEAYDYPDEASARSALDKQEVDIAILIPENLSASLLSGENPPPVTVLSDPTLTIAPAIAIDMVTMLLDGVEGGSIAIQTIGERLEANGLQASPVELSGWALRYSEWYREFQRDLFHHPERSALVLTALNANENENTNPYQQMVALLMLGQTIFFAFFTGGYAMMSILRESEEGTLARLFTTPIVRTHILAGKFLAVLLTVTLQGLVLLWAGRLAFNIQWGEAPSVALALIGQVAAASGLGALLISFVKTTKQGGPVLGGGLTVLSMLGGIFTANLQMPETFNALGSFTPQGWVLRTWKLSLAGAPPTDLLAPFLVTLALSLVMFTLGALMFKRRYA